jgi:glycosyltransferase involved in cell wall biosynthesis
MENTVDSQTDALDLSVVIPAFRRPELLRHAALSVFAQNFDPGRYELIVVDSSPSRENDAVIDELKALATCAFSAYHKTAEGPGRSRALGAARARGKCIAYLDSDCVAAPNWLESGVTAFHDKIGLVQGKTLPTPNVRKGILTHYVTVTEENHIYESCNIFYRRTVLLEVGEFQADLLPNHNQVMGGEDVDLAWRVKRRGWQSCFAPEALVYHAVLPIPIYRWFVHKSLFVWPSLVKRFPELRNFFIARYFYDRAQALFALALGGILLSAIWPIFLTLTAPYLAMRASEPSATLRGALRVLRPAFYLPRDAICFALLLAGSVRYRALLL